ncbi:unnamed protein product [Haemonchus placei]|uniref:Rab-GAP TBC domain-containing protein n=1 Tax=Haemonchus placei TaxID=6290 RepID=A0A0N4WXC7_HAEPC|nr:unnamed protein product [Haemonchus placei]
MTKAGVFGRTLSVGLGLRSSRLFRFVSVYLGVQIERSLLRTLPNNICFWKKNCTGIDALRRVLKAVAFIYPDLGFCEGMGVNVAMLICFSGVIVAMLLLICSEETTFWMMTALIEDILPPNYYSQTLLGVQV